MGLLDDLKPGASAGAERRIAVIVCAAGRGERFAAGDAVAPSKVEFPLDGKPAFLHAVEAFCGRADVAQLLLAVPPDRFDDFADRFGDRLRDLGATLIAGGTADRWQTVKRALDAVTDDATHVAVHDAARPLVTAGVIDRVFGALDRFEAVVPGRPAADTLVAVGPPVDAGPRDAAAAVLGGDDDTRAWPVRRAVPRAGVFAVQTPQAFAADLLRAAYARAGAADDPAADATDDAGRVAAAGHAVHVVAGDAALHKLTRPDDAAVLTGLLAARRAAAAADGSAFAALFDDDEDA